MPSYMHVMHVDIQFTQVYENAPPNGAIERNNHNNTVNDISHE